MINRDYLIVGAGLAGACACEGIREHDKKGSILLAGRELFPPYHRPQLSKKFLKNSHMSAEDLAHTNPQWFTRNHIEMRLGTVVREFNIERRLAVLQDGQVVEFRKALLATGSRPRRPQVAGATLGNVFYLNSVRDALAIREVAAIEKNIVVIGSGFIALEATAALTEAKCKVTLLARQASLWRDHLDAETSQWLTDYFDKHGIKLMLGQDLNGFEGKTVLKNVQTKRGDRFPAQMALVALGADPNLELVYNTPLSSPNGTPVNELLETDEKGIFAAGDIALFPDRIFGGVQRIQHWTNAREQGHIAGQNLTGKKRVRFESMPYFWSVMFDLNFEFFGDFSLPAGRMELEGDRDRKKFIIRCYRGSKLFSRIHCNQDESLREEAKTEIMQSQKG
ncbi:MAG TPA: FAD/NAD(P)-binding oxidoreductase [Chthoniobacteraceae bacterium]|jgi:NADPH-dependent 2,4-dienoyl-CoA reductase/sulfur reductase-like enzyme|nr:FAD/NAD(P)-binding oxidoreductase [Chthoniobacteraceae bacterium]